MCRLELLVGSLLLLCAEFDPSHRGPNDEWPAHAVGLQIVLQREHHRKRLRYDFVPAEGNPMSLTITFVLRHRFNDALIVKLSYVRLRYVFYMNHEYLTIESKAKSDDVEILSQQDNDGQWVNVQTMTIRPKGTRMYVVRNKTEPHNIIRNYTLDFLQLPSYKTLDGDGSPLMLHLPENNIAMKSYRWTGDELIYYKFKDADSIDIRCSASSKLMSEYGYIMNFNYDYGSRTSTITRHIHLTALDDRGTIFCSLLDKKKHMIRNIFVVFERKEPTHPTSTHTSTAQPNKLFGKPAHKPKRPGYTLNSNSWTEVTPSSATISPDGMQTTESPVTTLIAIASLVGALSLAVAVALLVWCARKKKRATTTGRQSLIENERTPTENQRGSTNEVYPPVVYDYAYVSNEETLTVVPHHTTAAVQGSSAYPRDSTPPVYDYAYDRAPRQPQIYRSFNPPEPAKNSFESDNTEHYTEIDAYFIQKQIEQRMRKK